MDAGGSGRAIGTTTRRERVQYAHGATVVRRAHAATSESGGSSPNRPNQTRSLSATPTTFHASLHVTAESPTTLKTISRIEEMDEDLLSAHGHRGYLGSVHFHKFTARQLKHAQVAISIKTSYPRCCRFDRFVFTRCSHTNLARSGSLCEFTMHQDINALRPPTRFSSRPAHSPAAHNLLTTHR